MAPTYALLQGGTGALAARSIGTHLDRNAAAESLLPIVSTLGVIFRIFLRRRSKIALKWDDYTIMIAVLFTWGLWGGWLYTCRTIVGPIVISHLPPASLEDFLRACWILEFFYFNGCNIVKFSILFFYLRAFGSSKKARIVLYFMFAFIAAYAIMRLFGTFFQCTPFTYLWRSVDPTAKGSCVDFKILFAATATLNLLTDLMIIIFPMPIVWKLQVPLSQKVAICLVFCMGALAVSGGLLRLYFVVRVFNYSSLSLLENDAAPKLVLSAMVELNIGMLTATLPSIRVPFMLFLKSVGIIRSQTKENSKPGPAKMNKIDNESTVVDSEDPYTSGKSKMKSLITTTTMVNSTHTSADPLSP